MNPVLVCFKEFLIHFSAKKWPLTTDLTFFLSKFLRKYLKSTSHSNFKKQQDLIIEFQYLRINKNYLILSECKNISALLPKIIYGSSGKIFRSFRSKNH